MTTTRKNFTLEQRNSGSGTFVAGDFHGNIEAVDPKTKALLEKMTKQAPDLAKLLNQALRDGVISPDMVHALGSAARSINEDVAYMLKSAAMNINEDVALMLMNAASEINESMAKATSLATTAETNSEAARQIESAASTIDDAAARISGIQLDNDIRRLETVSTTFAKQANQPERVAAQSLWTSGDILMVKGKFFLIGALIGAIVLAVIFVREPHVFESLLSAFSP